VLSVPKVSRSHVLLNVFKGAAVISQATRMMGNGCASVDHSVLALNLAVTVLVDTTN
jgi:hypothetical protein